MKQFTASIVIRSRDGSPEALKTALDYMIAKAAHASPDQRFDWGSAETSIEDVRVVNQRP